MAPQPPHHKLRGQGTRLGTPRPFSPPSPPGPRIEIIPSQDSNYHPTIMITRYRIRSRPTRPITTTPAPTAPLKPREQSLRRRFVQVHLRLASYLMAFLLVMAMVWVMLLYEVLKYLYREWKAWRARKMLSEERKK
ncbi:hypothetical protein T440DRAFT_477565 [Plenodomus tracheiphilus IPT5]|uniref:Copper transporter n=1 Tax=Plenodomus tracheiphilus IPT5 TaxID=1408161 RepID=A0A6A7BDV1_9PLEO|nr:hypothetical protein T440DRAFT_477565 [Plenodomus tracheiphilus IPT5]